MRKRNVEPFDTTAPDSFFNLMLEKIFREEGTDGLTAYYNQLKHLLEWKEMQHQKEIEDIRDEMSDVLAFRQKKMDEDYNED